MSKSVKIQVLQSSIMFRFYLDSFRLMHLRQIDHVEELLLRRSYSGLSKLSFYLQN